MHYVIEDYEKLYNIKVYETGEEQFPLLDTREELIQALNKPVVGGYITKTIISGPVLECEIYPVFKTNLAGGRKKAGEGTSAAQQEVNRRNREKHLIRIGNVNFQTGTWLTLTYRNGMLPDNEEQIKRDIQNYIRRLKRYMEKHGLGELQYIYVSTINEKTDEGITRAHHHIVMNLQDRDAIESLWTDGRTYARMIQPDEFGITGMMKYIAKHSDAKKRYGCSRNLKQPSVYQSKSKFSKRRAENLALNEYMAKELFEQLYTNHDFKDMRVSRSQFVSGCYIYARMRRRN